jgi:membrane protein DedA with SNARE-associated domain/membrane-associated phospholipid phosphatase
MVGPVARTQVGQDCQQIGCLALKRATTRQWDSPGLPQQGHEYLALAAQRGRLSPQVVAKPLKEQCTAGGRPGENPRVAVATVSSQDVYRCVEGSWFRDLEDGRQRGPRFCLALAEGYLAAGPALHSVGAAPPPRQPDRSSTVSTVVDSVLSLSGWWAYAVIGLLAFGEAAVFVGLVLPGETGLLLGGVLAATGHISLPVLLVVAALAAVLGDSVGYEVGRHVGSPLRRSRLGRRIGEERWSRAEQFVLRRGGPAVLLGRWVGVLRALVPALAGMTRMPYRRFLAWNLAGGISWATTVVLAGYATGAAWRTAAHYLGRVSVVLAVVAVLAVLGGWLIRRRRSAGSPSRRLVRGRIESAAGRLDGLAVTVGVLVAGSAIFAFAALGEGVMEGGELTTPDRPVLDWLVAHRNGGLTAVLRVVTDLGSTTVLPVLGLVAAAGVARLARSWWPVAFMATTAAGSLLLTVTARNLVGRPRPPATTALVSAGGFAFPSGHALNTAAIVGACAVLLWTYRRVRIWSTGAAAAVILLVGFSRLYLGVHWLTDVLAAYALGLGWLAAVATACHVLRPQPAEAPVADPNPSVEEIDRVPSFS